MTLVSVIERHVLRGITVVLSHDSFHRIIIPYFAKLRIPPDVRRALSNPYFHCFYCLIVVLMDTQRRNGEAGPIDFVFDEQGREGRNIRDYWYLLRDLISDEAMKGMMVNEPVFGDDKVVLPLQAADLTAWHVRHYVSRSEGSEPSPIVVRLSKIPHIEYLIDDERCQAYVENHMRRLAEIDPNRYERITS